MKSPAIHTAHFSNLRAMYTNGTVGQYAYTDGTTFATDTVGAMSFWFKPATIFSSDNYAAIIAFSNRSATNTATLVFGLRRHAGIGNSNTYLEITNRRTNGANSSGSIAGQVIAADTWYHVVVMSTGAVYINGTSQTMTRWLNGAGSFATSWFGNIVAPLPRLSIGARSYNGTVDLPFSGGVDEVMYFDRVLTAPEVTSLYNGGAAVNPRKLFADNPTMSAATKMYVRCGDRYSSGVLRNRIGTSANDLTLVGPPSVGPVTSLLSITPSVSVSDTTARIAFGMKQACTVAVRHSANADMSASTLSSSVSVTSTTDFTGSIDLAGLPVDTTRYYTLVVNGVDEKTGAYNSFKTFPAAGSAANFSFVFGSCTIHTGVGTDTIFTAVPASARFLLHLGDTIYADYDPVVATTLPGFRTQHRDALQAGTSSSAGYRLLRSGLPVFTIWDDHDITNDYDQGPGTAIYLDAKQAFQEYQARQNPSSMTAGELYYSFQFGDVGFFVLDQRSFRSATASTDNGSKTLLGSVQKSALKAWLLANKSTLKVKVICSATPMHGYAANTAGDSFGGIDNSSQAPTAANGYRTERNEIWDYIDAQDIPGVIVVSGDQHWSGAFKTTYAGRPRYEFGASPFNMRPAFWLTKVARAADAVNGPVFWKDDQRDAMGVVTINTTVSPATVSFQLYGTGGSLGASYLTTIDTNAIDAGL